MKEDVLEWLSNLEDERGVGPDGDSGTCEETGGFYNTIMWSIDIDRVMTPTMNDSEMMIQSRSVWFKDEDAAWNAWQAAFKCYLNGRDGMIYWRIRPELETSDSDRVFVRARVLVAKNLGSSKAHIRDTGKAEIVVSVGS